MILTKKIIRVLSARVNRVTNQMKILIVTIWRLREMALLTLRYRLRGRQIIKDKPHQHQVQKFHSRGNFNNLFVIQRAKSLKSKFSSKKESILREMMLKRTSNRT